MIFKLTGAVTVSAVTEVEADTLEEAIALAEARETVIGGIGTMADPTEEWVIEEADGEVRGIHE